MLDSLGKYFIKMTTQRFFTDEKIFEVMEKAKEECRKNPTKYGQPKTSLKSNKKIEEKCSEKPTVRIPHDPSDPSLEDYFVDELFKQAAMEAEGVVRNPNHYVNPMFRKNEDNFAEFIEVMEKALRLCKKIKGY